MAKIKLEGLVSHIIVTRLKGLEIATVLPGTFSPERRLSYTGNIEYGDGRDPCEEATIKSGLHKVTISRVRSRPKYPLYVSTAGLLSTQREANLSGDYRVLQPRALFGNELLVDDTLILHYDDLKPLQAIKGEGHFVYGNIDSADPVKGKFDGELTSEAGIAGDVMRLQGEFMLKLTEGSAQRDDRHPYPLKGDWEASFTGEVQATVGTATYLRRRPHIFSPETEVRVPSLIRVLAEGELLKNES